MKFYDNEDCLKKKVSYERNNNSQYIDSLFNLKLIHKILNTVNISLLILIFILFFLSFNSQRKWSNTYENLTKTKTYNNNLIDYISITEESYIGTFESLNTIKKTTPNDLIYLDKIQQKDENYLSKKILEIIKGVKDSKYQIGY